MSIGIATMGMFNGCCGTRIVSGGGAPPYRREEEKPKPFVLVKSVEVKDLVETKDLIKNIKITFIDDDGGII